MVDMIGEQQQSLIRRSPQYNKLLDDAKAITNKTADVCIPEACAKLRETNPDMSNRDIRDSVRNDYHDVWTWGTIDKHWPDWIKDPTRVMNAKERYTKQEQFRQIEETFRKIPKPELTEFREPLNDYLPSRRNVEFEPLMLQKEKEAITVQYKPEDIKRLCDELGHAIRWYHPYSPPIQDPTKNAIRIVDKLSRTQIEELHHSMSMTRESFDALYKVLEMSIHGDS
jgi:hypothetical protein